MSDNMRCSARVTHGRKYICIYDDVGDPIKEQSTLLDGDILMASFIYEILIASRPSKEKLCIHIRGVVGLKFFTYLLGVVDIIDGWLMVLPDDLSSALFSKYPELYV